MRVAFGAVLWGMTAWLADADLAAAATPAVRSLAEGAVSGSWPLAGGADLPGLGGGTAFVAVALGALACLFTYLGGSGFSGSGEKKLTEEKGEGGYAACAVNLPGEIGVLANTFEKIRGDLRNASLAVNRLLRAARPPKSADSACPSVQGGLEALAEVNVMIETFETAVKLASAYMAEVSRAEGTDLVASLDSGELAAVENNLKYLVGAMGEAAEAAEELVQLAGAFHDTTVAAWTRLQPAGNC